VQRITYPLFRFSQPTKILIESQIPH